MEKVATRGRPREFDVDQALAAALRVFWSKGYEAASLSDLTEAMGITRPSLYAAFGNKESLFMQALDLYARDKLAYIQCALEAPTGRGVAQRLLEGALDTCTGQGQPRGCLGVISSVSCANDNDSIREHVHARTEASRNALTDRMQRAIDEGDFSVPIDAEAITRYLSAVLQGLSVQASSGATREELKRVVEATLAMWPGR
jgi:AcrR family transcriptional regulator